MSWRVAIRLRRGEFELDVDVQGGGAPVAVVGPNGSGKTTLLRAIAGAHRPDSGTIEVGERRFFDSQAGIDLPPEARRIGYVPQGYGLFPHMSVMDNVAFGRIGRMDRAERRAAASELLESIGCAQLAPRSPSSLSGGERQRVALARALMIEPKLLLLDEPLAALDIPTRRALRVYLAEHLADRGGPALVATHDVRDVRALNAHVYVMEGGRIVQDGDAEALAADPASEFVAEFFG